MATAEKEKIGIDQLDFLPLGAEPSDTEVIDNDDEDVIQGEGVTEEEEIEEPDTDEDIIEEDIPDEEEDDSEPNEGDDPDTTDEDDDADEDTPEPSIFESAIKSTGLELDDPSFEGINMEDPTTDDLNKFVDVVSEKLSNKKLQETFKKYPEAEGFLEFAKNGGDPRQYIETMYPQFEYSSVDYDEQVAENETAQEQLVRAQLSAEGTEPEEIDELVEDYRAGGLLAKQSKRALRKLTEMQNEQKEQLIKKQKDQVETRKKEAQKQRSEIEDIIENSKSIKGLKLPKTDREDLKTYLFEPVNEDGQSQAFIDGNEMSHEERVAVAYLKMKGFDFESLIGNEAETRQAKKLKSSIKKSKDDKVTRKREKEKRTSGKIQDIKPIF